ncbi:putative bifunctional diguanylate cyclase/phosphodiesterase [Paraburkholderia bannensis]|uniref:putative bifunctional diguanylate cyclase/phosphodiesterase n=1 Tax=Paraburkholderia bannensis TaxID=765414 RepID=UPI002AB7A518|nr:bifunctional diguanylate cyclase/phosphodiesterase [Paraburkholderia bannensis]
MNVLGCIVTKHNPWLVIVAVLICGAGSWVTARLVRRAFSTHGMQRAGWQFLAATTAAVAIWCTHFVAMLGYEPGVPVSFDPVLTIVSLLIALVGSFVGIFVACSGFTRAAPAIGGALVGLAISLMHYTGMTAYRVEGLVTWNRLYLVVSIAFSVVFGALAFDQAARKPGEASIGGKLPRLSGPRGQVGVVATLLATAIATLHFIGMCAFEIEPLAIDPHVANSAALEALALAVAGMAFIIAGAGLVSYLLDDSVRAESVEHLRTMALSDMLTGLPNRAGFNERLDAEITRTADHGGKLALVGIDLNRFKDINDLRGHHAGDEVLRILALRFKSLVRDDEFVARVGGDEFVALRRFSRRETLDDFLHRLEAALFRPIRYDDWEVMSGASMGVAIYPDDATSKTVLINNADLAMYRAKADLTRSVCFYEPKMDETARARRSLAADLRDALSRGQLSVHYQVQTSIASGEICGYEALLRWEHPRQGFISPGVFIPLAEENGLILAIGAWVLREACSRAVTWQPPCKVAVNLSPVQFAHADLPSLVDEVLKETGLPPSRLELELTESTIFADRERSLETLQRIKALGVSLALDDFGTGYSSLDTLRSFPFDKIKLDQSFVSEAESSRQATAIIRAVLALGKSLGIPVLAEGIETQDQLDLLAGEGCDEVQGFLLGRPVPLAQLVASGKLTLSGAPVEAAVTAPATAAAS